MRRARPAIVLLGCLIAGRPAVAQSPATNPAAPPAFVLAVDEGGTLLPIARVAGGRWLNTWPEPEEDTKPVPALAAVPRAWLDRPVPSEWTLWPTGGGPTRMTITGTARSGGCVVSPKLTLPERRFPPEGAYDQVHPGLATTEGGAVRAIEMMAGRSMRAPLPAAGAILDRARPVIASLFATHQKEALARAPEFAVAQASAPLDTLLASSEPRLEWLYRVVSPGATVVYFEASKRPPPATSYSRLTVIGWLRIDGAAVTPIGIETYVGFDESPPEATDLIANVSDRIPLGVVRAGPQDVWVMETPSGESHAFVLYDVGSRAARRLLRVDAGGC
jgi:hypothetical protein